ncbi:hypothetical protein [Shewanella aestuarii]|uniref:Uncharacterized protein n=1 Tax=Shewanella aestuarii TaxID=1028752 RepID=A0A6G9QHC2_9GAMM|nr:hypothetical protein [Shewanella aestuarii]QIR13862.1 hypothetical protein HBH39_04570 [Shewanella aestuarii]
MSQQDDEFLALQDEISLLYHRSPKPEPSAQLDELVLAKAHAYLRENLSSGQAKLPDETDDNLVPNSAWQKYRWQLSTAASVFIIAGLFMMVPMEQSIAPTQMDMTPQPMSVTSEAIQVMSADTMPVDASHEAQQPANVDVIHQSNGINSNNINAQVVESRALTSAAKLTPNELDEQPPVIAAADSALLQLKALINRGKWQESMALLADIEQRFPEVTQPNNKLYSQYTELKQRLNTQ